MEIAARGRSLDDLGDAEVMESLEVSGQVVVRGCRASVEDFQRFVHRFGDEFVNQEAGGFRDVLAMDVSSVVKGSMELALHMERGYSPLKPDLCWFLAIAPAETGGAMTFGDGEVLFDALPGALQAKLASKQLLYRHRFGPETWRPRYGTREQIEQKFAALPSIRTFRFDDDILEYEHVTPAVYLGKRTNRPAYINSLVLTWQNMMAGANARVAKKTQVMFEDGEQIGPDVIDQIATAFAPITERVTLEPGEVAFVDNYRYMHGRDAFTGDRKAAAAFGSRRR